MQRGETQPWKVTPFPCNPPRDRLPRSAREITDAAAGIHCGARPGGVADRTTGVDPVALGLVDSLSPPLATNSRCKAKEGNS